MLSPANFVLIVCSEGKDSFDRKYIDNWTPVFLGINPSSRRWDGKFRKIQSLRNPFKSLVISNFLEQVDAANLAVVSLYIIIIDRSWVKRTARDLASLPLLPPVSLGGVGSTRLSNEYLFIRRTEEGGSGRIDSIERYRARSISVGGGTVNLVHRIYFFFFSDLRHWLRYFFFFFTSRWVYILYTRSKIKIWGIYFVS